MRRRTLALRAAPLALLLSASCAAGPVAAQDREADVPAAAGDEVPPPVGAAPVRRSGSGRPLAVLQIGDSHTAADFLTGQLRRLLQAEYGDGGAGYLVPGRPRSGVRNSALKIQASPGWTYTSLQGAKDNRSQFSLSGYEATTSASGETLTYTADGRVPWDQIEIEAVMQPGAGAFTVSLDGKVEGQFDLAASETQRIVFRLTPEHAAVDRVQSIAVTTTSTNPVRISGLSVRNLSSGVSVSAIGFPGATVDIVNKFDGDNLRQELRRLNPDVVLMAFGTNEGFNDNLDPAAYRENFRRALGRIRRAVPAAQIVLVAPPQASRLPASCKARAAKAVCQAGEPAVTGTVAEGEDRSCVWRTPVNLGRVREVQRKIAEEDKLVFWNWAEIMGGGECGPHEWAKASPALMADDHVHMTIAGYRQSADRLAPVLRSVLGQVQARRDAVPDR